MKGEAFFLKPVWPLNRISETGKRFKRAGRNTDVRCICDYTVCQDSKLGP